jgi:hypothetical protein
MYYVFVGFSVSSGIVDVPTQSLEHWVQELSASFCLSIVALIDVLVVAVSLNQLRNDFWYCHPAPLGRSIPESVLLSPDISSRRF